MNLNTDTTDYRCGFVAIVGRPNVGKSTLMNHLIGQKISITSKKAQTTRHKVKGIYTDNTAQLVFVDTPGYQTYHRNALNDRLNLNVTETVHGVDVIVFVIEALRFTDADRAVLEQMPKQVPVVFVVNKLDKAKDRDVLAEFIANAEKEYDFVATEVVSAKHGLRITQLIELLKPMLPHSEPMYPEDMVTDKSSRFLAMEIVREKLFRYLGEELPYSMNVEVEQFEEDAETGMYSVYIAVLVDRDNQKAIVIGKGGERLKKISTEARVDMEKLFDTKVFLKVWVKVKSGWADDIRFLNELGM